MSDHKDDNRPDPDKLLSLVQIDERREKRSHLKIFLGMAAGVGKTYAMLNEARELKAAGVDVVIGFVEAHGRQDTLDQIGDLETVPRLKISYKGVLLEEMDLDAVIRRKPKLVLVDELAHTNAPGCRHTKRYLDILELIRSGIDVYTTVNIQHVESRIDAVQYITGVKVGETVPDTFFDNADEITLIDLPPEGLIHRLLDGRIYPKERIETAERNFFQKGNLTALREMSLRLATERVDKELRDYKQLHGIEEIWKSGSRLMVAIFASPYSEMMVRWARRLADLMGATWIAAYVETNAIFSDEEKSLLAKNMALVHALGGEVITTRDDDTVAGLIRVAKRNNVTQIIMGKSKRGFLRTALAGGSIAQRLISQSGDIDIYFVTPGKTSLDATIGQKRKFNYTFPWQEQWVVLSIAAASWGVADLINPFIGYVAVGIVFLLSVFVSGLFVSRTSVFLLAFLFSVIHNFFFIPPLHNFSISKPEDFMTLAMFFIAAAIIGHLTSQLKNNTRILHERENRALALYDLSKKLTLAQSVDEVARIALHQIEKLFHDEVALFLKSPSPSEKEQPLRRMDKSLFATNDKEQTVALWTFKNNRPAGRFTDTLSAAEGFYIPLPCKGEPLGVIGINFKNQTRIDTDEISLLETFASQISAALERETFHEQSGHIQVMEETQKLYKTLLDSVSHELKTPLAAIKGSASALLDPTIRGHDAVENNLLGEVLVGAGRLQRLVDNLLDMTRIESGMLRPKLTTCDFSDIVGSLLRRMESEIRGREVVVTAGHPHPDVLCDPILLEQALANILHNALNYSPHDSAIEIGAHIEEPFLKISIRDHGPGFPEDKPMVVFDKFYRGHPEKTGGVGLGLSIAKNLIELQKGQIMANNHPDSGAVVAIYLPLEKNE